MMNARQWNLTQRRPNSSSDNPDNEVGWDLISSRVTRLKQVSIAKSELTYAERGKGEAIVFVHGALGDYRTWSQQLDSFSNQYHAVSYSRRYHQPNVPESDSNGYTYRRHVDDLISLIETLKLGPAYLVGHSYGGAVATMAAMKRPDLVGGLVLAEPSLFSIVSTTDDKVSLRFHRIAMDVVQKLAENGEQRLAVREYINIVLGKDGFDDLPLEAVLVIWQNVHTLGPMLRMFFELPDFDPDRLQTIKSPTLVITGESSPRIYSAISHELHSALPDSELLTLAGASHGLHIQNPRDFNDAVFGFLSKNPKHPGRNSALSLS